MCRATSIVIILGLAVCAAGLAADDHDPIQDRLHQARTDYDADLVKARAGALALLDRRLEAVQMAGDLVLVKKVRGEREAFADRGESPTTIDLTDYHRTVRKARDQFADALAQARKEYTRAGKIPEAEAVDGELEAFKKAQAAQPRDLPAAKARPEPPSPLVKARDDLAARLGGTQWRWGGNKVMAFHADGTATYANETLTWVAVDGRSILVYYPSNKNWDRMTFDEKLTQVTKEWIGVQERKAVTTSVRVK
jgi:hypothetical protein